MQDSTYHPSKTDTKENAMTTIKNLTISAAIVAAALLVAGCGAESTVAPTPAAERPVETSEPIVVETAEPEPEPTPEYGTRSNPLAYDEWAYVENLVDGSPIWDVKVGVPFDATQAIADENMFNEPPQAGNIYLAIPVSIVYQGPDKITPWVDFQNGLDIAFVTNDGRTIDEEFVVQPWPSLMDISDLYTGGAADFVTIVQLAPNDAGLVRVTAGQFDYFVGTL